MTKKIDVAVLGATGMVGQEYVSMLVNHPFFDLKTVTGKESVGKRYGEATRGSISINVPKSIAELEVMPTEPRAVDADLVFSPLPTDTARVMEPQFAQAGFPVVSDASANRMHPDVPLMIPEVNPDHIELVFDQRKARKWDGFMVTTPNCTTVGLAMVLKPLYDKYRLKKAVVTTMQALSGAGYPGVPSMDILDNVIPYISGEEEKVRKETRKLLGTKQGNTVADANIDIAVSCNRVAVLDGHFETLYLESDNDIMAEDVSKVLSSFAAVPQELGLPSAPEKPIIVRPENDRPQPRLDRMAGSVPGMSVTVGRIRQGIDSGSIQLSLLSHNTVRGAAGCAILTGELLVAKKIISG